MQPIHYPLITLNLITFLIYAYDKYLATRHKRRIAEKTLLLLALIGGSVGAGLGMLFFRHKVAKWSFLWKYFLVVALQVGARVLITRF